jgi:hypothetical protein
LTGIPTLLKQKQEDHEFIASLACMVKSHLKTSATAIKIPNSKKVTINRVKRKNQRVGENTCKSYMW